MSGPVLDAPDVPLLTRFYEQLLGWEIEAIEERPDILLVTAGRVYVLRTAAPRSRSSSRSTTRGRCGRARRGRKGCNSISTSGWRTCPPAWRGRWRAARPKPHRNHRIVIRAGCGSCSTPLVIRSVCGRNAAGSAGQSSSPCRDPAEASGPEVVERLDELLAGVHHERSVRRDGLADRLTTENQNVEVRGVVVLRLVGGDADRVAGAEHRELTGGQRSAVGRPSRDPLSA